MKTCALNLGRVWDYHIFLFFLTLSWVLWFHNNFPSRPESKSCLISHQVLVIANPSCLLIFGKILCEKYEKHLGHYKDIFTVGLRILGTSNFQIIILQMTRTVTYLYSKINIASYIASLNAPFLKHLFWNQLGSFAVAFTEFSTGVIFPQTG